MISGASRVMRFNAENFISRTMLHFTRHCFSTPVFLLLSGGSGIQTFYTVHKSSSSGCSYRCIFCHGAEIRREVRPVPSAFGFQGTSSFPLFLQKWDLSWLRRMTHSCTSLLIVSAGFKNGMELLIYLIPLPSPIYREGTGET